MYKRNVCILNNKRAMKQWFLDGELCICYNDANQQCWLSNFFQRRMLSVKGLCSGMSSIGMVGIKTTMNNGFQLAPYDSPNKARISAAIIS